MLYAVIAMAGVIALITLPVRVHAFVALLIGALSMGLAAGLIGSTLGNVGIPLFFEIGVVLLLPVIFTVATRLAEPEGQGRPSFGVTLFTILLPVALMLRSSSA